jgi:peptidoglycan/xylan/chitin deacetylase (PgdA/CDA1 family)
MIPILLYHSVSDQVSPGFKPWCIPPVHFAEQMAYLKQSGYLTLTITQLVQWTNNHPESLPSKVVAITFDDGFQDFRMSAFPVLNSLGFPATMYVPAAYVGKTSAWLEKEGEANRPILTWEEISQISEAGIEIGAHSLTHHQLDTLSKDSAWNEIQKSKEIFERQLGHRIESFAYPHGYYSKPVRQMVMNCGYSSAAAVKNALSDTHDDRFALARMTITSDISMERFAKIIEGVGVPIASRNERFKTTMWRAVRRWLYVVQDVFEA